MTTEEGEAEKLSIDIEDTTCHSRKHLEPVEKRKTDESMGITVDSFHAKWAAPTPERGPSTSSDKFSNPLVTHLLRNIPHISVQGCPTKALK
jgi:hypothetical protein